MSFQPARQTFRGEDSHASARGKPVSGNEPLRQGQPVLKKTERYLLALQRNAGNTAVTALVGSSAVAVQRQAAAATSTRFMVGSEVQAPLAAAAKAAVADGQVDDRDLASMRQAALANDDSVDDYERMFMAALLDPQNTLKLRKMRRFAATPDAVVFADASISSASRTKIANLDRQSLPATVTNELRAAQAVAPNGSGDPLAPLRKVLAHWQAAEVAAARTFVTLATAAFEKSARDVLSVAGNWGVSPVQVLLAAGASASDSTPGDIALAGAVYVIASLSGSPLESDVLTGRIKVDEVPPGAMTPGHWAEYKPVGGRQKGDTIYLPNTFDVYNLAHRGAAVHELEHAAQDKASAGPTVGRVQANQAEVGAYRKQARFLLDTLVASPNPALRKPGVGQIASNMNPPIFLAMVLEALSDPARMKPIILEVNAAIPAGKGVTVAVVNQLFTLSATRIDTMLLTEVNRAENLTAQDKHKMEGLSGESLLDWTHRPGAW